MIKHETMSINENMYYRLWNMRAKPITKIDERMKLHWHEYLEIIIPINFVAFMNINGKDVEATEGEAMIVNVRMPHYALKILDNENKQGYGLQINLKYFYPFIPELLDINFKEICDIQTGSKILTKIIELEKIKSDGGNAFEEFECVYTIVKFLYENEKNIYGDKQLNSIVVETIEYIKKMYMFDICIKDISGKLNISQGYLIRLFKKEMHQTIHEFIMDTRVSACFKDILNKEIVLMDIADKNGFPNYKSFVQEFKKRTSVTPQMFRDMKLH